MKKYILLFIALFALPFICSAQKMLEFSPIYDYLHYTDGSGTPYYNGNISSMTWKSGSETTLRGYKFTYDALNRLKDAAYGEGTNIASASAGNYSEKVTSYDWNGNILSLQRYGKLSSGSCGKIDDLTYGAEYTYDANGNLTKDSNKKISVIEYNFLNLPCKVTFADGSSVVYTYTAAGTKLKAVHKIGGTTTTTDYCGNVIYENGVQKSLLTEAGYVTLNDKKYHYYLQDHQGNNRVVINSNGTVEESNHYYPFGGTFASSGSVQPYKYNGKELDAKNGLNWYDYGARQYDAAVGRFTTVDPLAEKFSSGSSYIYCFDNPIKFVDPDGKQGLIPVFGLNPPLLGTSNPMVAAGRNAGMLGTADKVARGLPKEEHHIIPRSLGKNDVVKAAREGGFKLDGKGNKMSVDKFSKAAGEGQHAKHPKYTNRIEKQLNDAAKGESQLTPEKAVDIVKNIISKAKNIIENNPNTKINDLKLDQQVAPVDNTRVQKPAEPIKIQYRNQ